MVYGFKGIGVANLTNNIRTVAECSLIFFNFIAAESAKIL